MDLDATIKGVNVSTEDVEKLIDAIIAVPIDDGVSFQIKSIMKIMDEAEYPGIRVSMTSVFDSVVTPLKIDISTGDAITPKEVRYRFKLMLEDRSIDILAYNLETVLAEKLETIITRTVTNTRMRERMKHIVFGITLVKNYIIYTIGNMRMASAIRIFKIMV